MERETETRERSGRFAFLRKPSTRYSVGALVVVGMLAASTLYREIGREVERRGLDSVSQRAVVGAGRKLRLLAATLPVSVRGAASDSSPPLEETRFLVEAAAGA